MDIKVKVILGFAILVAWLIGFYFLIQLAKDDAIYILVIVIAAIATGSILGKMVRDMLSEGGICKLLGLLIVGIFAVGTLVLIFASLATLGQSSSAADLLPLLSGYAI